MLFKKINLSDKNSDTPAENKPQIKHTDKPIYILGNTAIAYFLAARFTAANIRTIILAGEKENLSLSTNGLSIKDDYHLQKLHCRLETDIWQKEYSPMVIIACTPSRIKSNLISLTKSKLKNTPIISFTPTKDKGLISDILGFPVSHAYYDGWIKHANQEILVYGQTPEIILCEETHTETFQVFNELLQKINLSLHTCSMEEEAFWNFFSIYGPCSLITAASGKNIFEITKSKALREQLLTCLQEISKLPPNTIPPYTSDDLLKKVFNIPSNYNFPLAEQIQTAQTGDLDFISSVIQQAAFEKQCFLPTINLLLKTLYEQILNKQSS